jgi:hypothetical protein
VGASDGKQPSAVVLLRNRGALYQVVKVEAGPETTNSEITCRVCDAHLPAREGKFALKYFML